MKRSALRLHAEARAEVLAAQSWYWERSAGVADAFLLELEHALDEIAESPDTWPSYLHNTRRFVLHRFPYLVVYRRKGQGIQIVAVAHAKRRPGYWIARLP